MICKHVREGDKLKYLNGYGWVIKWREGGMSLYPALNVCISPDIVFRADDQGHLSIIKSSLQHSHAKECFNALCAVLHLTPKATIDENIWKMYDADPNYVFQHHFKW